MSDDDRNANQARGMYRFDSETTFARRDPGDLTNQPRADMAYFPGDGLFAAASHDDKTISASLIECEFAV